MIWNWCCQLHAELTWSWPKLVNRAIFWHLRLTEQRKRNIKSRFIFRYSPFTEDINGLLCSLLSKISESVMWKLGNSVLRSRGWSLEKMTQRTFVKCPFTGSPGQSKTRSTSSRWSAHTYVRMRTRTPGWYDSRSPVGFTISYRTPRNRCTTAWKSSLADIADGDSFISCQSFVSYTLDFKANVCLTCDSQGPRLCNIKGHFWTHFFFSDKLLCVCHLVHILASVCISCNLVVISCFLFALDIIQFFLLQLLHS